MGDEQSIIDDLGDMLDNAKGDNINEPENEELSDLDENDQTDNDDEIVDEDVDDQDEDVDDQDEEVDDSDEDDSDSQEGSTDTEDQEILLAELEALKNEVAELKSSQNEDEDSIRQQATKLQRFELDEKSVSKLRENHGEIVDGLVLPLAKQLNTAMEALNDLQQAQEKGEQERIAKVEMENFRWSSKEMDKLAATFPQLGQADKLHYLPDGSPNPKDKGHQLRAAVYERADALYRAGLADSFQDAFQDAVFWLKGTRAEKDVKRDIVKGLNKRKKRISGRPSGKRTKKKRLTGEAAKLQMMDEVYKEAGIDS